MDGEPILVTGTCIHMRKVGTVMLTPTRFIWKAEGVSVPNVSIQNHQIKNIYVSASNVQQCLLKITLIPQANKLDGDYLFQFTGSSPEKTLNSIKTMLHKTLNETRSAKVQENVSKSSKSFNVPTELAIPDSNIEISPKDAEVRALLLSLDDALADLHQNLVISGILEEEEFWSHRLGKLCIYSTLLDQERGHASPIFTDIRPVSRTGNVVKYVLNSSAIYYIMRRYPGVYKAYVDNVPHKISENEFWKQYFQSKLFYCERKEKDPKRNNIFDLYELDSYPVDIWRKTKVHPCANLSVIENENPDYIEPTVHDKLNRISSMSSSISTQINSYSSSITLHHYTGGPSKKKSIDETISELYNSLELVNEIPQNPAELKVNLHDLYQSNGEKNSQKESDKNLLENVDWNSSLYDRISKIIDYMDSIASENAKRRDTTSNEKIDTSSGEMTEESCITFFNNTNEIIRHFWSRLRSNDEKIERLSMILLSCKEQFDKICSSGLAEKYGLLSLKDSLKHALKNKPFRKTLSKEFDEDEYMPKRQK